MVESQRRPLVEPPIARPPASGLNERVDLGRASLELAFCLARWLERLAMAVRLGRRGGLVSETGRPRAFPPRLAAASLKSPPAGF